MMANHKAVVAGAGLAGCEAAWMLANNGIPVILYERKPESYSPAHRYPGFAELVCSNSFKADRLGSAAGMLKEEMRRLGSLLLQCAERTKVEAGGALAVDRERFSDLVTEKIMGHDLIEVVGRELTELPEGPAVIATGPLTSDRLAESIQQLCGSRYLSFYDAAAPIVSAESIDPEKTFAAARYGRGGADYINCPLNKEEYERFHQALTGGETVRLKAFETDSFRVYEGCMPIEVLAKRGQDALRYGPMKPVGLTDPRTGRRPWAVAQLRQENREKSLYNLVGFQTNLRYPEQKRIFSLIPGLESAEFVRYGVMHRNTFLDSPRLLNSFFSLRKRPGLFFAGQITGVEGYMESAASGILAGINLARMIKGKGLFAPPVDTMTGALSAYVSDPQVEDFQPMGSNMGILPALEERIKDKALRYEAIARRGLDSLQQALYRQGMKLIKPSFLLV